MKYIWITLLFSFLFITSCVWPPSTINSVVLKKSPCIIPIERYEYKTCEQMTYYVDGEQVVIPAGFKTDLASIPRPLWSVMSPRYGAFIAPAILHDYLYHCVDVVNRRQADDIFYSALIGNGVTNYTSTKFYIAVRLFGWRAYNKDCDDF